MKKYVTSVILLVINTVLFSQSNIKNNDSTVYTVVEEMPKFYKPGFQKGKAIRLQYMIPFDFYVK